MVIFILGTSVHDPIFILVQDALGASVLKYLVLVMCALGASAFRYLFLVEYALRASALTYLFLVECALGASAFTYLFLVEYALGASAFMLIMSQESSHGGHHFTVTIVGYSNRVIALEIPWLLVFNPLAKPHYGCKTSTRSDIMSVGTPFVVPDTY